MRILWRPIPELGMLRSWYRYNTPTVNTSAEEVCLWATRRLFWAQELYWICEVRKWTASWLRSCCQQWSFRVRYHHFFFEPSQHDPMLYHNSSPRSIIRMYIDEVSVLIIWSFVDHEHPLSFHRLLRALLIAALLTRLSNWPLITKATVISILHPTQWRCG